MGLLPLVGGLLAELVTESIPRLREDRIVEYLRELSERLAKLEQAHLSDMLANPEKIDLIEAGGHLAVRATAKERIERIAELVSRGLSHDDIDLIRRKRLLQLFGEIDDDEFLLLNAYGQMPSSEAWAAVQRPDPGAFGRSQEVLDEIQLFELGRDNLVRLGLLEQKEPLGDHGRVRVHISRLGRMLLSEAGVELQQ